MADGVLDWAKRQRKAWKTETKLLEKGYKKTFEVRDGVIVDTTDETLTDLSERLAELQPLIKKHEAK